MNANSPPRRTTLWPLVIVCVLLAVSVWMRPRGGGVDAPAALPPLMAQGWLNAEGAPDVAGKVVVVDAWATWCDPCLRALPEVAATRERHRDDDVVFVGLTAEPASARATIEATIARFDGFDWPVGYGARPTLDALSVTAYPTLFVFDRDGAPIWAGHSATEMARQLDRVL